jgi:YD repeat-containing protein
MNPTPIAAVSGFPSGGVPTASEFLWRAILPLLLFVGFIACPRAETYVPVRAYYAQIYDASTRTWIQIARPSFEAAAAAAWSAWKEPSYWPGAVKQDWFTNKVSPRCRTKEEPAFVSQNDYVDVWSSYLHNGSLGCSGTNFDAVIFLTCPGGGYLWYQECMGAADCAADKSRNPVTGLCELNPKNRGPSDGCPSTDTANPINSAIGNKHQTESHYRGAGGFPLTLEMTYNALGDVRGANWGLKWQSNWDRAIGMGQGPESTVVGTFRPDGKAYVFSQSGSTWSTTADVPARLERLTDASGALSGWRHVSKRDQLESYDAAGRLISIGDRTGAVHALSYDKLTRLVRITDAFGRQLEFGYDSQHRGATMTDPASQIYRYTYDALNNLSMVAYPDATAGDDTDFEIGTYSGTLECDPLVDLYADHNCDGILDRGDRDCQ